MKPEEEPTGSFIAVEDRPNPHHIPRISLANGLSLYGCRVNNFFNRADGPGLVEYTRNVRKLDIRHDDVLIAAYPKSGTHWLWEVVHMLVHGTTSYAERVKEFNMLEYCDLSQLQEAVSPRVFNSHLWIEHLPQQMFEKKTKIIHIVRNPKDVLVSYYHHYTMIAEEGFTLQSFMKAIMDDETLHIPNQLEYLRRMSRFQATNPDHPFKLIYYENMKRNPVGVTKELAEFLDVPHTAEFCHSVAEACSFDKLRNADKLKKKPDGFAARGVAKVQMYRKGEISDWKNHLTVSESEEFDAFIEQEVKKGELNYDFMFD